jgi:hypothetical protein
MEQEDKKVEEENRQQQQQEEEEEDEQQQQQQQEQAWLQTTDGRTGLKERFYVCVQVPEISTE